MLERAFTQSAHEEEQAQAYRSEGCEAVRVDADYFGQSVQQNPVAVVGEHDMRLRFGNKAEARTDHCKTCIVVRGEKRASEAANDKNDGNRDDKRQSSFGVAEEHHPIRHATPPAWRWVKPQHFL